MGRGLRHSGLWRKLLAPWADNDPITRRAMRTIDANTLLRRSRAMARAVYVGQDAVLCRVLTRYRLYVAADDAGFGVHVMLDGAWENWLTAFMAARIEPGMVIVDAGANHGYYTLLFAHLTGPEGRVAAIEPNPRTAELLRRSVSANGFQPWVTVFEAAAGAEDGATLRLHTPANEPKNAHVTTHAAEASGSVPVPGARLETMLAGWPRVDFIKIDVEGAEEAFLEGAWPLVVRDRPMMVLEFNAHRCADPDALLDRLEGVYGRIGVIMRDGKVVDMPRAILADPTNRDDRMLYLTAA